MIGDALVDLLLRAATSPATVRAATEWVRDASRPPLGVELRVDDGSVYTGVVIVKENVPIAMIAFKGDRSLRTPHSAQRPAFDDPCFTATTGSRPPVPQPQGVRGARRRAPGTLCLWSATCVSTVAFSVPRPSPSAACSSRSESTPVSACGSRAPQPDMIARRMKRIALAQNEDMDILRTLAKRSAKPEPHPTPELDVPSPIGTEANAA